MNYPSYFEPLHLGNVTLRNRIVMAPLTRMRAGPGNVPTELNTLYYAQRASAGLIIAEGTAVSQQGQGYPNAPGIYTPEQVAGWQKVAEAVHNQGGRIFLQLAHNGRNSHSSLMPDGGVPVAPSPIPPDLPGLTRDFQKVPIETPRELTAPEIREIIGSFAEAAISAIDAGFDGVELQGANSHLIDQFLEDGSNVRTDSYGGSTANRMRFLLEIVDSVTAITGSQKLGVRLSPFGQYGGIHDSSPMRLFTSVVRELNRYDLAYLHLIEGRGSEIGLGDALHNDALENARIFRPLYDGILLSAAAYTPGTGHEAIRAKHADAIAFGRLFIANPDLVERIEQDVSLNAYDRSTFYGGGERGYTDYPAVGQQSARGDR